MKHLQNEQQERYKRHFIEDALVLIEDALLDSNDWVDGYWNLQPDNVLKEMVHDAWVYTLRKRDEDWSWREIKPILMKEAQGLDVLLMRTMLADICWDRVKERLKWAYVKACVQSAKDRQKNAQWRIEEWSDNNTYTPKFKVQ